MNFNKLNFDENYYVLFYFSCVYKNLTCKACCSAGKCRIAGKRNNLRKMSQRRREMSQSAENVVNPTAGICRIVDGKCRKKKSLPVYVATSTGNVAIVIIIIAS